MPRYLSACIALGVMLLMATPSFAEDVHEYRLDNGLLVLLKENHNAPVINLNIVYRVGSKYERPGITGISHLLEHMMFKTSENLPLGEFDKRLKAVGADNNAYTWLDQTVYYETIAADQIDVALMLEAERMQNLSILPEDHQFEMTVVRNELEQRDDTPFTLLYEELLSAAFKAHPYNIPTIGWLVDVEGILTADIRQHYDTYYQPDNAFIVAVGDFDPDELFARIEEHFGGIPAAGVELPRLPAEPAQLGERRITIERAGQIDYLLVGWHVPESEHPDSYPLVVLGQLLGQGRTSRLYSALVDSGKCASAQSWCSSFSYADPFLFFAMAALNPGVAPADAEEAIYDEIARIIAGSVSNDELARAKKQARVSFVYDRDSIESEAQNIVSFELMSGYADIDNYLPGIEAVTGADIQRVAAEYLAKRNRTVGTYIAIKPEAAAATPVPTDGADEQPQVTPPHYRPDGASSLPAAAATPVTPAAGNDEAGEPYATVTELANGLTVVIKENHNNATVSINGLVRAGKIDDPPGLPGVGNFVVSMLSNGTTQHSKLELAGIIENAGIELGFAPSRESFTFGGRSLSEDFDLLLDTAAEELLTSNFPEEEVELVRQQLTAGLLQSMDQTFDQGFYTGRELVYGAEHPFAGRIEGTPESLVAITRGDLVAWYEAHVIPDGAVLSIAGDVNTADALAAVKERFGDWQGVDATRGELLGRGAEFVTTHGGQRHDIDMPDKSNVSLQWMGPGVSKLGAGDWAARLVANFIFGGDMSSRINERLRIQDGLTYGAFSWFSNSRAVGPFCISVQVNPENVEAAIAATEEELQRYIDDGVNEDELKLTVDYLTGNFPVSLSTNSAVAGILTESVYLDKGVEYIWRYPGLIRDVTAAQVQAVAHEYMTPDKLLLVVAGSHNVEQ